MIQSERKRFVFSLIVEHLDNIEDLSRLRIALNGDKHECLSSGWLKFLQYKHNPLILRYFTCQLRPAEKPGFVEFVKKRLQEAYINMKNENRFDPYDTLVAAIESCKEGMEPHIKKAKGPAPGKYIGYYDSDEWEDEDEDWDLWEGRTEPRVSKSWLEWLKVDSDIKETWTSSLVYTLTIIQTGTDEAIRTTETQLGRRLLLIDELKKYALVLRHDSFLCKNYIKNGSRNVHEIAKIMLEMKFLYDQTNYPEKVANKIRSIDIETLKLYAVKEFVEDHPDRLDEVPDTLMAKAKERFEDLGEE